MPPIDSYVALLRGINVGGRNMLPMKTLAAMFIEEGAQSAQTYIQSGNVVFTAECEPQALAEAIENRIKGQFGIAAPIVLRSAEEMATVVNSNPFAGPDAIESELYVMFLKDRISFSDWDRLDPNRSPPDEFQVIHREIYLRLRNGAGKSRLTNAYFDSKLKTVSTARNWRTVARLNELCQLTKLRPHKSA